MKLNWGTSIIIAFALFITFILYFVFKVQSNSKYDNELVVEEYYKHDSHFGEEMDKRQNAADLDVKPIISNTADGINIVFPKAFLPQKIKGKVSLYRPSAKKMDFEIPISLSGPSLLIPKSDFADGLWDITVTWSYEGKTYMIKKEVYIN